MNTFKVGDMVTWKNFINRHPSDQWGHHWDGPAINPKGYKVISVDVNYISVETKGRDVVSERYQSFSLIERPSKRKLPAWF